VNCLHCLEPLWGPPSLNVATSEPLLRRVASVLFLLHPIFPRGTFSLSPPTTNLDSSILCRGDEAASMRGIRSPDYETTFRISDNGISLQSPPVVVSCLGAVFFRPASFAAFFFVGWSSGLAAGRLGFSFGIRWDGRSWLCCACSSICFFLFLG